jgi:mannose-6-phosphate isomerase-like protein (cupin superfamily)
MTELDDVRLVAWTGYRRQLAWQDTEGDGFRIALGPSIEARGLSARLIRLPPGPGGTGAYLDSAADRIWLQVRGDLELGIGAVNLALTARDLAYLPAGEPLRLTSIGEVEAVGLEITIEPAGGDPEPARPAAFAHRWADYSPKVRWDLPLASQWGFARGSFPPISIPGAWAHLMRHLPGQSAPVHSIPTDLIFIGLEEIAEFEILGETYNLGPYDLMVVPADTPYKYSNYGFAEAIFLDVGLTAAPGHRSRYFIDGAGKEGNDDREPDA